MKLLLTRSLALAACCLATACNGGGDDGDDDQPPACGADVVLADAQARTTAGVIQGQRAGATFSFKGVPFAAPPVGDLRYRPPQPPACREGVSDAIAFAPACPQVLDGALVGAEDCLYLNVWTPDTATPASALPVLVFIHGGGHQQGAASQTLNGRPIFDGQRFAERSGAIVVTVDYRLGPLGFLAHPTLSAEGPEKSGNYGMLDQIAALAWVRDNITAFGGDPSRVMAFGESAGAVSTCRLLASPLAAGLFSAIGIESGACVAKSLADAEAAGVTVAQAVGCSDAACLRGVTMEALLATVEPLDEAMFRQGYDGVVDGHALLAPPLDVIAAGTHNRVPTIIGTNSEEQARSVPASLQTEEDYEMAVAAFAQSLGAPNLTQPLLDNYPVADYPSPRAAMVAIMTDAKFSCPTRKAVRALTAAQDEPVYRYVFSKVPDNATPAQVALGAFHGIELFFLFEFQDAVGPNDRIVIDAMHRAWSQLAVAGDPNAGGALPIAWPPYDLADEAALGFDDVIELQLGYRNTQCDFLDSL